MRPHDKQFKGKKAEIKKLFNNFTTPQTKAKNGSIPISLIMGNFRRKKIIETIKDSNQTYE